MIEPTEGEIVDVLNNYLNSGSRDTFHQILIGRAIAEIERLRKRLLAEENVYDILRIENEHLQTDRNNLALEVERLQKELQESEKLVDEYQRENADRTRLEN